MFLEPPNTRHWEPRGTETASSPVAPRLVGRADDDQADHGMNAVGQRAVNAKNEIKWDKGLESYRERERRETLEQRTEYRKAMQGFQLLQREHSPGERMAKVMPWGESEPLGQPGPCAQSPGSETVHGVRKRMVSHRERDGLLREMGAPGRFGDHAMISRKELEGDRRDAGTQVRWLQPGQCLLDAKTAELGPERRLHLVPQVTRQRLTTPPAQPAARGHRGCALQF